MAHNFPGGSPDTPQQLTDGTVLVHDACTTDWYKLTPDKNGSYLKGKWKKMAAMPGGYNPLYFASQVLSDGRVVVNGGEYSGGGCSPTWTDDGAIYDPVANHWTAVAVPANWHSVGDAQSVVLPNGGYMLANALSTQEAIATFSGTTPTWTPTGTAKKDGNDEEGWTLIPFGRILTVDASRNRSGPINKTEIYDIASGTWSDGEDTPNQLVDPTGAEVGPAVLIPSGIVFQVGGKPCPGNDVCQGHTATFSTLTNHWKAGPDIPLVDEGAGDSSDGPAALLPNGNVLVQTSPKFLSPSHFFEYNGKKLIQVSEPDQAPDISSYESRMMILPTGEILWTSDQGDMEIYSTRYATNPDWAPVIAHSPKKVIVGHSNYAISGLRFNGMTQGAVYGDDAQFNTNYPLVRITNTETGHVCYARTHDHSTMGINASDDPTSTNFDVPATCETGPSTLVVVANGMASPAANVKVNAPS